MNTGTWVFFLFMNVMKGQTEMVLPLKTRKGIYRVIRSCKLRPDVTMKSDPTKCTILFYNTFNKIHLLRYTSSSILSFNYPS